MIEQFKQKIVRFISDRNYKNIHVRWDNVKAYGRYYGYTAQETGYALQQLRNDKKVFLDKRDYSYVVK